VRRQRRYLAAEQDAALVSELISGQEGHRRLHAVEDTYLLEHALDVVVDDSDARQVVQRGVALQHADGVPGAPQ
jgi:hypothetical protein